MLDKNIIENLPIDLQRYLAINFLDAKSMRAACRVSQKWFTLFSCTVIWQQKIIRDFDIDQENFAKLPVPDDPRQQSLFYKNLYARLLRLKENYTELFGYLKRVYRSKTNQLLILISCADDEEYAFTNTPCEEQDTLVKLSIYAGCFKIPIAFFRSYKGCSDEKNYYLNIVAASGNLELLRTLLNPDNKFGLRPKEDILDDAIRSGNFELIRFFLNPDNKFELNPDQDTLHYAAKFGTLEMVQFFLEHGIQPREFILRDAAEKGNLEIVQFFCNEKTKFGIIPYKWTLNVAAKSGNLELIRYLLNPANKLGLTPDHETLNDAAVSGNLELVRFFLNPENKFGLKPEQETLHYAARSGNLELVCFFLNLDNKFGLVRDFYTLYYAVKYVHLELVQYLLEDGTLNWVSNNATTNNSIVHFAADSGNFELLWFFLNPENQFGLQPDQDTLSYAAGSGSLEIVRFLLNPDNNFGLQPNIHTLDNAAGSGSLELVRFLLDPVNKFRLKPTYSIADSARESDNYGLAEHLIPSAVKINKALKQLKQDDFESAKYDFQQAYHDCPNYFWSVVNYVLSNPAAYKLTDEAFSFMADTRAEIEKDKKHLFSETTEEKDSKRRRMS